MSIGSGIGSSLTFGAETTYGIAATTDHALDFDSESLVLEQAWTDPQGLAAGRQVTRAGTLLQTTRSVSGDVSLDFWNKNMGLLVRAMLGSSLTAPVLISGQAYRQIHQLGNAAGRSLTLQVNRPEATATGTDRAFTYPGVKVAGWELASAAGEQVKLSLDLDGRDELTNVALAAPSYPAGLETFQHHSLVAKLGGTPSTASGLVSVAGGTTLASVLNSVSVKGTNPLAVERYGASQTKNEPIQNGFSEVMVDLDLEFNSKAEIYDVWRAGTATALQLTWTGSSITGGNYLLDVIIPAMKFTTAPPNVDGPDLVKEPATLRMLADGTNAPIQIVLVSTDVAL